MIRANCNLCRYFAIQRVGQVTTTGDCHRYPNMVEVERTHWCGEFTPNAWAISKWGGDPHALKVEWPWP